MCAWACSPGADLGGRVQGVLTPPPLPPPEMPCGLCRYVWYVFSAVHIMLLPSQKPSSSYSLLKFVYVNSQLRHFLVVHPLQWWIPGGGRRAPLPLFLDQTEARRAEKFFFGDRPPPTPLSKGLSNRAPLIWTSGSGTRLLRKILDPPM